MNQLTQCIELVTQEDKRARIMSEGFRALSSINESCHAVSTKRRFSEFCRNKQVVYFDSEFFDRKKPFHFEDKVFDIQEEFRQTGYGAWHIGSRISELQEKGKNFLVVNASRNRRFLMVEREENEFNN